jgi:hypothetical protein
MWTRPRRYLMEAMEERGSGATGVASRRGEGIPTDLRFCLLLLKLKLHCAQPIYLLSSFRGGPMPSYKANVFLADHHRR